MYDVRPKLRYIDVSHNIIDWLEINGKCQPSISTGKLITGQTGLNQNIYEYRRKVPGPSTLLNIYDIYERKHINFKSARHTNGAERNTKSLLVPNYLEKSL